MRRNPPTDPLPDNSGGATGPADDSDETGQYQIHRRDTFPASGRNVAFSLNSGPKLTGSFEARLSWDVAASPDDIVIHLSAFLLDSSARVPVGNPYYCVNHDNDRSKDGSTLRRGRRRHGSNISDETISVDLDYVDEDVMKIAFVAYIQDAEPLDHSFEKLVGGKVTFKNTPKVDRTGSTVTPQIEPHLLDSDYFKTDTAVIIGELVRRREAWTWREVGKGFADLVDVGEEFGVVFIAE
ncbi:TerD family protein [Catellatospora tritici]|uniref:TerD family protein n=1 Tax=Catellatospora tritici TaxID=2851566 RepID=UPI001C2D4BE1|nr:TerD family protein [Catellatospora tritici]MBV1850765.1 TerD family protein [Catellatospora tritici]MBV1851018.1 TerD family protein [Catellatospora tritici]